VALLDHAVGYLEHAAWLDRAAELLDRVIRPALGRQPIPDVLSGRVVGHPVHPLLVAVPTGA
jgi:hypothetical protein